MLDIRCVGRCARYIGSWWHMTRFSRHIAQSERVQTGSSGLCAQERCAVRSSSGTRFLVRRNWQCRGSIHWSVLHARSFMWEYSDRELWGRVRGRDAWCAVRLAQCTVCAATGVAEAAYAREFRVGKTVCD
eukprot:IDg20872t1